MFNPPAALLTSRVLAGETPRRRDPQAGPALDDPWLDPFPAAPALPQRPERRRQRRMARVAVALFAPARRLR